MINRKFAGLPESVFVLRTTARPSNLSKTLRKLGLALLACCTTGMAVASTYSGPITVLAVSPAPAGGQMIRVSVIIGPGTTSCSNSTAYAFEFPDSGYGKIWTAMLMSAHASGRSVQINGNGICDAHNVEGVSSIHLL